MNKIITKIKEEGEFLVREYVKTKNPGYREKIVLVFSPLVKYIIGRINFSSSSVLDKDDLYQCGIIGLLKALEKYSLESKTKFSTFAYKRIYGEVIDCLRKEGLIGKDKFAKIRMVESVTSELTSKLGMEPATEEICREMDISEEEYYSLLNVSQLNYMISLNSPLINEDGESLYLIDTLKDESQISQEDEMNKKTLKELLKKYIPQLTEKQKLILALYFYEELTLNDIGQVLDLTESRVSQILNTTLVELKSKVSEFKNKDINEFVSK